MDGFAVYSKKGFEELRGELLPQRRHIYSHGWAQNAPASSVGTPIFGKIRLIIGLT